MKVVLLYANDDLTPRRVVGPFPGYKKAARFAFKWCRKHNVGDFGEITWTHEIKRLRAR